MLSKDVHGCRMGSWMVQRLGHEDSPIEMFGIFRLSWVRSPCAFKVLDTEVFDNQLKWVMADYTLTQEQAMKRVQELAPPNAEIHWRI